MLAFIRRKVAGLFQKAITDWLQRTNNRLVSENTADWGLLSDFRGQCNEFNDWFQSTAF